MWCIESCVAKSIEIESSEVGCRYHLWYVGRYIQLLGFSAGIFLGFWERATETKQSGKGIL